MNKEVKIIAIGTYIAKNIQSNYNKSKRFGYDDNFLENKLGFKSISVRNEDETTLDMCLSAFEDLRKKVDIDLNDIQLVTVVTQNPTINIPHTSAMVHNLLKLSKNCMTFDISQGCSGFCHALQIIKSLMNSLNFNNALIFTSDSYRNIVDENDPNVSMIFGDGAAATLLSRGGGEGYEIIDASFGTAVNSYECLITKNKKLSMDGGSVFRNAAVEVPPDINQLVKRNNLLLKEMDLFLFHQGSKFIVDSLAKIIGVDSNKTEFSSSEYGNTVSSSLPILLSNYFGEHSKTKVLISGFGVGFTWGNCLLQYEK